ncbi:type II secretion system GspH family protein [Shewanella eurypsychrophilus]|uniref:Type II secretion system GspH family protein n=1 Tax=Shewanella eurypsychrophilus TaxID=2593656 RepID=A0ABX6VB02_9GAMM|nr:MULTISPECIES: type II secretion system protein [Shewanella]QFU24641.1 prepilin-type N-terminal cleavage/methylation domain-containing protein [Shewanella sp. YLB-09]QPG59835.1 type II secretion system GspH family protein [Shewanella eurypsychrophilus]
MLGLKEVRSSGFTLVEMVMVIIILGVLVLGVSSFVILGTRIFVESTSVDQVLSQSRFVMERMTREIRNAVPNSLRVTNNPATFQCIEFVPIQGSASYLDIPIAPAASALTATVMIPSQGINPAQQMLVYPLLPEHIYSATPIATEGRLLDIASFADIDTNTTTITFDRAVRFSEASPRSRFFMVRNAVSYCFFANGNIRRYNSYNMFRVTQPTPDQMGGDAASALMAESVVISDTSPIWPISYTPGTLSNNAVVQLTPQFAVNEQAFQYQHQVQVVNVP